jgi:2-polyprenyl-6-methoxyphenol hydroxylase-like FAD-dependent oxidoreductase
LGARGVTWNQSPQGDLDVVIVGSGATGLTLACELARRGVSFRIFEKSPEAFVGSRAKGIQPRTLEVFDGLGAVQQLLRAGGRYPPMRLHLGFLWWTWHMIKRHKATPDVPYPDMWLVPQWRTEQVLRDRLNDLNSQVEHGAEVMAISQNETGVTTQVLHGAEAETLRSRYLVGTDGGRSFVRKHLGVTFEGTTSKEGRMIVGDVLVDGLSRDYWHVWPTTKGMAGLCPLPNSDLFQLMLQIDPADEEPALTESAVQARWLAATGLKRVRPHSPTWLSVFRPNVRLVDQYRKGRAFLAGDAAHVHTPAGAQGLNTGVQDAWNLGWKLAAVLRGAPESLLDTYEAERMPVAVGVLALSNELFRSAGTRTGVARMTRGDEERQLLLHYRSSSLSVHKGLARAGLVVPGDRAPDAPCLDAKAQSVRLFDAFRGGHFTTLAFGAQAVEDVQILRSADPGFLRVIAIRPRSAADDVEGLVDDKGDACRAYGIRDEENVVFLIRPDGYVGLVASLAWRQALKEYLSDVVGRTLTDQLVPDVS